MSNTFTKIGGTLQDVLMAAERIREERRRNPQPEAEEEPQPSLEQRIMDRKIALHFAGTRLAEALSGAAPCCADDRTFDGYNAETPAQEKLLRICRKFSGRMVERIVTDEPKRSCLGLCFCGRTGTGKTHLASAIYADLKAQGCAPVFMRASSFFNLFKGETGTTANRIAAAMGKVSCLMLDEIGRTAVTAFETNLLLEILDARQRRGLPTVLTSNLSVDALRAALGDAITSRFPTLFYVVSCTWDDYRKKQAAERPRAEEVF